MAKKIISKTKTYKGFCIGYDNAGIYADCWQVFIQFESENGKDRKIETFETEEECLFFLGWKKK